MMSAVPNPSLVAGIWNALLKSLARSAILVGLAALALGVIAAFTPEPVTTFFRLLAWAGLALFAFSVASMLFSFRRARNLDPPALIASLATSCVVTCISVFVLHSPPDVLVACLSFAAGSVLGAGWATTNLLYVEGGRVSMRGTLWSLAVWGFTLAINQAFTVLNGATPQGADILALVGTGVAVGNTACLLVRAGSALRLVGRQVAQRSATMGGTTTLFAALAILGLVAGAPSKSRAEGAWILSGVRVEKQLRPSDACYLGRAMDLSDGGASFSQRYADCTGEGRVKGGESSRTAITWKFSPSAGTLTPGRPVAVHVKVAVDPSSAPFYGGGAAYLYFRTQSAVGGIDHKGYLNDPGFSRLAERDIEIAAIPSGAEGDKLTMWVNVSGDSGGGDVFYDYVFRQAAGAGDAPTTAIAAASAILAGVLAGIGATLVSTLAAAAQGAGAGPLGGALQGHDLSGGYERWKKAVEAAGGRVVRKGNVAWVEPGGEKGRHDGVPSKAAAEEMSRFIRAYESVRHRTSANADKVADSIIAGGATPENLERARRLLKAVGHELQQQARQAELDKAAAESNVAVTEAAATAVQILATAGQFAAQGLEATFVPASNGMVSGFFFGAAQSRDQGLGAAVKNGVISAVGNAVSGKIDSITRAGGAAVNVAANAAGGAIVGAATEWAKGSSREEMKNAAAQGAIFGGLFSAAGHAAERGAKSFGFDAPAPESTHAGEVRLSPDDIRMDAEFKAKLADARERVGKLESAIQKGDAEETRKALHDVLDHREARQIMGGSGVDDNLKRTYGELTREHRTRPLFDSTAEALNAQKTPGTDQSRFVIRNADGTERPITGGDFASGSGSSGGAIEKPGMDLDMYPKETIIDRTKGGPARRDDIEKIMHESCEKLGIDHKKQEINLTGNRGPEDFTMRPGEDPKAFMERLRSKGLGSALEGQGISEVGAHKLAAGDIIHESPEMSSAVAEQARGIMKDQQRLVEHLINKDARARIPSVFQRRDPATGETPLSILKKVGDGTLSPGTGNAQFRRLTGMNITDATPKMASWAEALGKWKR